MNRANPSGTHTLDDTCCILLAEAEPHGVSHAASCLAGDIWEACGCRPEILEIRPTGTSLAIIIESNRRRARQLGFETPLSVPEAFVIRAIVTDDGDAVLISGADELGAIHGVYHFSQTNLGADPLKFWTGFTPPRRNPIPLAEIDHDSMAPTFRYRGFHLERIDDIHGWKTADGQYGFHIFWEKVFETILRLRGNMVKPGTNDPGSQEVALAQKMGLLITQEHAAPLGVGSWEIRNKHPDANFSFRENPGLFTEAWEEGMQRYPRPENVIWTVNLRGCGDRPFWTGNPSEETDEARGELISAAIRMQVDLVKKHYAQLSPVFIYNLWMEGVRLYREGYVQLPDEVHVVWPDDGFGIFQSLLAEGCPPEKKCLSLPTAPTGGRHGVYYHVSMYDCGAPDLAQFVPPERIRREFAKTIEKEATFYLLLNVGRVREQMLGAGAVMEVARDARRWTDPDFDAAEDYWQRWCRKYFDEAADEVRQCYRYLYDAPIKWAEWGGWDGFVVGDMGYYRRARYLVMEALSLPCRESFETRPYPFCRNEEMTLKEQADHFRKCSESVRPTWEEARAKSLAVMEKLTGNARNLFEANVLAQIEIHLHSNQFLLHMIEAVTLYDQKWDPWIPYDRMDEIEAKIRSAKESMCCVHEAMARMEGGKWTGWNKTNYWSGWEMAEGAAETFLRVVKEFQVQRRG